MNGGRNQWKVIIYDEEMTSYECAGHWNVKDIFLAVRIMKMIECGEYPRNRLLHLLNHTVWDLSHFKINK